MSRLISFLSSMPFAISLLSVIGIASSIGTFIKQNEPHINYLNQFGPFWFELFNALGLFNIYASLPFLAILTFLLISTSLCIKRQTPAIWRDFLDKRNKAHWQNLQRLPHFQSLSLPSLESSKDKPAISITLIQNALTTLGGRIKIQEKEDGFLATIRHGRWQRLGYIFTHLSIVIICIGGLLDGQFPLRMKVWFSDLTPVPFSQQLDKLPANSILPYDNSSFRANVFIPEGEKRDLGLVIIDNGRLWQELPFSVELEKFNIDHYENGMPQNFESKIVIRRNSFTADDSDIPIDGLATSLFVNKPVHIDGYTIFQSGFDDGGSKVSVQGFNLATSKPLPLVEAAIGDKAKYLVQGEKFVLELDGFRVFNVERRPVPEDEENMPKGFLATLSNISGSAGRSITSKVMRNFGPKLTYKIRNDAGQAVEVQTYMIPVELEDGLWFWLSGIRQIPTEPFRYLRIPVYDGDSIKTWLEIKRLLSNTESRAKIIYAYLNTKNSSSAVDMLFESVDKATQEFLLKGLAFVDELLAPTESAENMTASLAMNEEERLRVAETLVDIVQGVIGEAWRETRQLSGMPLPDENEASARYVYETMMSLHSVIFYPSSLIFQLTAFEEKPATALQIARAPGQNLVYLGCAFLVLGVMLMIFVQDRRLYVWLANEPKKPSFMSGIVRRGPKMTDEQFQILVKNVTQRLQI